MRRAMCIALIGVAAVGCGSQPGATDRVAPPGPEKQLLAQPQLDFVDGKITQQGTAFFVRAPDGATAAVTASHYLDQNRPALV
jgi:hypothetical protein